MKATIRSCRHAGSLLLLGCVTFFAFSCEDDRCSSPCIAEIGTLQGYITAGGEPVSATVELSSTVWAYFNPPQIETFTDSTGWYSIDLPSGDYYMSISGGWSTVHYASSGDWSGYFRGDPLHVPPGLVRLDFKGAALTVRFVTEPAVTGLRLRCVIHSREDGEFLTRAYRWQTIVDGETDYAFSLLPPATYYIRLEESSHTGFWLPGTQAPEEADSLVLAAGEKRTLTPSLEPPGNLLAHITGSWQAMEISEPWVSAYSEDSLLLARHEADASGDWSQWLFGAEPIRLLVEVGGVERWLGGSSFRAATLFDLQPGSHLEVPVAESGIECTFQGPGYTSGHDAALQLAGEDGTVVVRWFGPERQNPAPIPNLEPGTYFLQARPDMSYAPQVWCDQWYDQADSFAAATPITVTEAGTVVPITMYLGRAGSIHGSVTDGDGQPVPERYVHLYPADDPWYPGYGLVQNRTSIQGAFSFVGLRDGEYKAGVMIGSRLFSWFPGTIDWDSAAVITVLDHQEITGVDWSLP